MAIPALGLVLAAVAATATKPPTLCSFALVQLDLAGTGEQGVAAWSMQRVRIVRSARRRNDCLTTAATQRWLSPFRPETIQW